MSKKATRCSSKHVGERVRGKTLISHKLIVAHLKMSSHDAPCKC